jgi:hypothetical protein
VLLFRIINPQRVVYFFSFFDRELSRGFIALENNFEKKNAIDAYEQKNCLERTFIESLFSNTLKIMLSKKKIFFIFYYDSFLIH